uniref:C-factor n=1 Tax=Phasianus colchicus TaxID=9054 RepID=A0A669QQ43_PHACC
MGELRVRSVLVTGANRGIGLGFVQHLLALPNPPEWVFAGCRDPKGQRAQVRLGWDAAEVGDSRAAAGVGMCEGLHHGSPGHGVVLGNGLLETCPPNKFLCACFSFPSPQAFLPLLKKAAQGSPGSGMSCSKAAIVNISSNGGSIKEVYLWEGIQAACYRCSKAALNMLTRCQSMGYREHGIFTVALHPGWVQTDLGSEGGAKPPLTVDASVGGMMKVLSKLSEKDSGTFLDWEGNVVAW